MNPNTNLFPASGSRPFTSRQVSPTTGTATAIATSGALGSPISPHDTHNVLSRLHALFSSSASTHPGADDTLPSPVSHEGMDRQEVVADREAIKVFMVTWNMGDALPKGDLKVLFGEVPTYTPASPTEASSLSLPKLPSVNAHPYHLVVVAGQECPTPSGVPRGLGGVMKGMSVRGGGHQHKKKEDGEKDKKKEGLSLDEEEGEYNSSDTDEASAAFSYSHSQHPGSGHGHANGTRVPSPLPQSTPPNIKVGAPTKGWGKMLDDWFCGPPIKPPQHSGHHETPQPHFNSTLTVPQSPILSRSASAPAVPTSPIHRFSPLPLPESPDQIRGPSSLDPTHLAPLLSRSPLSSSVTSIQSDLSTIDVPLYPDDMTPPASAQDVGMKGKTTSLPLKIKPDRPELVIPSPEPGVSEPGTGCYVHLVKERLMGMYLSIYVYKGCERLVQGVDKDFVTAGLAGGRLGNKGGIGISLKLADHRFLFVNSHLAAHTGRQSARLANVAKIKADLRLDTFLPKEDPRNQESDITDRFDSTFWCGDLNFRLEMSRLHAQWLVDQRRYDDLLQWDQLRNIMKDPVHTPFAGFEEGPIDFPPTFKYDVWKSVKATNRDIRRSLRRSGTVDGKVRQDVLPSVIPGQDLSPMAVEEQNEEETGNDSADDHTDIAPSRRSFESSNAPSIGALDLDTEEGESGTETKHIDASAYGSRHKAFEVALKRKTKKFLTLVKMDGMLTPKGGKRGSRAISDRALGSSPRTIDHFDETSRRASVASIASTREETVASPISTSHMDIPAFDIRRPSGSSVFGPSSMGASPLPIEFNPDRRPSAASSKLSSASPESRGLAKRMSVLKRTVSGRVVRDTGDWKDVKEFMHGIDEDHREGVYDTSKKQRVPSWCDRVLWKTHIIPDPEDENAEMPINRDRGFSRLSQVLSNLGGHFRSPIVRSVSRESGFPDRGRNSFSGDRPHLLHHRSSAISPLGTSPTVSPVHSTTRLTAEPGLIPPPREASPIPPVPPKISPRKSSGGPTRHPLTDLSTVPVSPSYPKITFDLASPSSNSNLTTTAGRRPRANSDGASTRPQVPAKPSFRPRTSHGEITNSTSASGFDLGVQLGHVSEPFDGPGISPTDAGRSNGHARSRPDLVLSHAKTEQPHDLQEAESRMDQRNAFVKFVRDFPNWLHPHRSSSGSVLPATIEAEALVQAGRQAIKKRQRGEVECLHYGTIDDAGMRLLEGRSDHRPAIFAAAVYI